MKGPKTPFKKYGAKPQQPDKPKIQVATPTETLQKPQQPDPNPNTSQDPNRSTSTQGGVFKK